MFVFAGRRANLEIQLPYIEAILDARPTAEYHLWDLTRTPEDAVYIREVAAARQDGRIVVRDELHPGHPIRCTSQRLQRAPQVYKAGTREQRQAKVRRMSELRSRGCRCVIHRPPYEEPYQLYADHDGYRDDVFIKLDDDVLFLETKRLDDLLAPLDQWPNAIVSANVINNAVCAKHDMRDGTDAYGCGDPSDPRKDRRWWALHMDASFACLEHDYFIENWRGLTDGTVPPIYSHTRPGEAISINCIAFTHATMRRLAKMFERPDRLGDEGAVDRLLPRIATTFHAAHLTFGPQDLRLDSAELDTYRKAYAEIAKEYLA